MAMIIFKSNGVNYTIGKLRKKMESIKFMCDISYIKILNTYNRCMILFIIYEILFYIVYFSLKIQAVTAQLTKSEQRVLLFEEPFF